MTSKIVNKKDIKLPKEFLGHLKSEKLTIRKTKTGIEISDTDLVIKKLKGILKGKVSTEDFLKFKKEEKELEERKLLS
jgi:hypothetical protein